MISYQPKASHSSRDLTWTIAFSGIILLHGRRIPRFYMPRAVNDTAERAVKLMQDFHGLITVEEEQKQFLLRCVKEHRRLYPDCKKDTLKRKYPK